MGENRERDESLRSQLKQDRKGVRAAGYIMDEMVDYTRPENLIRDLGVGYISTECDGRGPHE